MKKPDDKDRLKHMLDAALDARNFLGKATFEELQRDRKLGNAIVRSLEIIGEAAANVTKTTQAKYPEIKWPVIVDMRNRLIHACFDINYHIVWQTVKENLPPLIEQ
ncbi:MAG: DUF86 domain-containing protein, partial [Proteobacteria bacterium]|nr:DUF86 domain-containing protein [Pseudomonadota bacterium]